MSLLESYLAGIDEGTTELSKGRSGSDGMLTLRASFHENGTCSYSLFDGDKKLSGNTVGICTNWRQLLNHIVMWDKIADKEAK